MTRGKGYTPDPARKRTQRPLRHLLGAAPAYPSAFSLEAYEAPILDQNACGSCTGHGTAQGIYVAFGAVGAPLPWVPSPGGIYTITRCLERPSIQTPLTDSGGSPADVMTAISNWGIRPMRAPSPQGFHTDVDPSNVNDEPKLDELGADALNVVVGEYRIDETAPDAVSQVCASIARGVPVGIGVFVDTGFENWDPSSGPYPAVDLTDPAGGGHWLCVTSYRIEGGTTILRGPNSWGPSWGSAGHFEVTDAWLRAAASDIYALNVAHKGA